LRRGFRRKQEEKKALPGFVCRIDFSGVSEEVPLWVGRGVPEAARQVGEGFPEAGKPGGRGSPKKKKNRGDAECAEKRKAREEEEGKAGDPRPLLVFFFPHSGESLAGEAGADRAEGWKCRQRQEREEPSRNP